MYPGSPISTIESFSDLNFPIMIAGPAHCGKSNLVTDCLGPAEDVAVIGTADLEERAFRRHLEGIQKHRPKAWTIVEEPINLGPAMETLAKSFGTVVVDSLNQWLGNLLVESMKIHDPVQTIDALRAESAALLSTIESIRHSTRLVIVSSEVGACPSSPRVGDRIFRQSLGQLNAQLARQVPTVIHVQYGLASLLKGMAMIATLRRSG